MPPIIIETIQRFFTKNPTFFKYVQYISALVAVVAYLPDMFAFLSVDLPSWFALINAGSLKVGAFTAIIIAQLPNQDINPK